MPISSSAATLEKKKLCKLQSHAKSIDQNDRQSGKSLLKIASALPAKDKRCLFIRSHSTLNASAITEVQPTNVHVFSSSVTLRTHSDGSLHVSRLQDEKETQPDRISLDRRGLVYVPIIDGEVKLRLLSLQHNSISGLETLEKQSFPTLVFLDLYDNQLQRIHCLGKLESIRVLLLGKNRIKQIEGLETLSKLEVLDLHGNQISQVEGLSSSTELKVLNLAGNQLKVINSQDFTGLQCLQELNLRRNKLKKLLGFAEVPSLSKLFISNNNIHTVEDIRSLAKAPNIKEITIDNNPISLEGECISFLVSYLPLLTKLNMMQITEQVRKSAMAWRRNKESTDATFKNLASDVSLNCRREEVISNAKVNWELLRTQTKYLTNPGVSSTVEKTLKNLKPDSDSLLTALPKSTALSGGKAVIKAKICGMHKVPVLPEKKLALPRTPSQDTDTSQNTSNGSSVGGPDDPSFKLPPILVPIINKMEEKGNRYSGGNKCSGGNSSSSVCMNADSSESSLDSELDEAGESSSLASSEESESEGEADVEVRESPKNVVQNMCLLKTIDLETSASSADASSVLSGSTSASSSGGPRTRSALYARASAGPRRSTAARAATAKARKQSSPALPKDREQGSDYLIEICGRRLNVFGQGALRFVDRAWTAGGAHDVHAVHFHYVNFNGVAAVLAKLRHRFPNIDQFVFKETNIAYLGQLNALAELQGLTSLVIEAEGNPICHKEWQSYAIYRLAHWGLKFLNDKEITDDDVRAAEEEYRGLSELVAWSLPEALLRPLLARLRIDIEGGGGDDAKRWLLDAEPELRKVVSKETLQWKKPSLTQEDATMRQKAKQKIAAMLEEVASSVNKLVLLEKDWPKIFHDFVQNTLLDYSQLDIYMKRKIQEL